MSCSQKAYVSKKLMDQYSKKKEQKTTEAIKEEAKKEEGSDEDDGDQLNRSCEAVHSDDLEGGLNYSDEEPDMMKKQELLQEKKQKRKGKAPAKVYKQEVDTNVFRIGMSTINEQAELATGDPVFCK